MILLGKRRCAAHDLRPARAILTQTVRRIGPIAKCVDVLRRKSSLRVHEAVGTRRHGAVRNCIANLLQLITRCFACSPGRKVQVPPAVVHVVFNHNGNYRQAAIPWPLRLVGMTIAAGSPDDWPYMIRHGKFPAG